MRRFLNPMIWTVLWSTVWTVYWYRSAPRIPQGLVQLPDDCFFGPMGFPDLVTVFPLDQFLGDSDARASQIWNYKTGERLPGPFRAGDQPLVQTLILGQPLFVLRDGAIEEIDNLTGQTLRRYNTLRDAKRVWLTPQRKLLVVLDQENYLMAADANDGHVLWYLRDREFQASSINSVSDSDLMYDQFPRQFRVDLQTGEVARMANNVPYISQLGPPIKPLAPIEGRITSPNGTILVHELPGRPNNVAKKFKKLLKKLRNWTVPTSKKRYSLSERTCELHITVCDSNDHQLLETSGEIHRTPFSSVRQYAHFDEQLQGVVLHFVDRIEYYKLPCRQPFPWQFWVILGLPFVFFGIFRWLRRGQPVAHTSSL